MFLQRLRYRGRRGSNPQPSDRQSDAHNLQVPYNTKTYENQKNAGTGKSTDLDRLNEIWEGLPGNVQKAILALAGLD